VEIFLKKLQLRILVPNPAAVAAVRYGNFGSSKVLAAGQCPTVAPVVLVAVAVR